MPPFNLDERALTERMVSTVLLNRPLRLLKLTGEGLLGIGADVGTISGTHALSRDWSRVVHDHPAPSFDGILYRSRHDDEQLCIALFDRAGDALGNIASTAGLAARELTDQLTRYSVGVV